MPIPIKELEAELLNLPPSTRALLARRLIASLDAASEAAENEQLWFDEAERRWEKIAARSAECVPADEAIREAREMLKRRP